MTFALFKTAGEIARDQKIAAARAAFSRAGFKWPTRREVDDELAKRAAARSEAALDTAIREFAEDFCRFFGLRDGDSFSLRERVIARFYGWPIPCSQSLFDDDKTITS